MDARRATPDLSRRRVRDKVCAKGQNRGCCRGQADKAVDAILKAAKTGQVGDGKIFVSTIDQTVRIRTGESGEAAL
jgi:hypothetical protein